MLIDYRINSSEEALVEGHWIAVPSAMGMVTRSFGNRAPHEALFCEVTHVVRPPWYATSDGSSLELGSSEQLRWLLSRRHSPRRPGPILHPI